MRLQVVRRDDNVAEEITSCAVRNWQQLAQQREVRRTRRDRSVRCDTKARSCRCTGLEEARCACSSRRAREEVKADRSGRWSCPTAAGTEWIGVGICYRDTGI